MNGFPYMRETSLPPGEVLVAAGMFLDLTSPLDGFERERFLRLMFNTAISGNRKTISMTSPIESTVKALVEFEAELDRAKAEVSEAKRRAMKDAVDWAEEAKASAITKARAIASEKISKAREEAESEADAIRKRGESDLRAYESSISKNRSKAAELVAARLLGGSG